jgi:hypothetical protein
MMDDGTLVIPFGANKGEIIDACSLFVDAGYINNEIQSSKMSSILQRVQSTAGTIVHGYDEGDDFIDDSEIVAGQGEAHTLEPGQFRVVLMGAPPPLKPAPQKVRSFEDPASDGPVVPDRLNSLLDRIKRVTFEPIERQLERLHAGAKTGQMINLTNDIVEAIADCVDEKIRIESEAYGGNPPKRKVELWKKDAFQVIYNQCFTVHDYQFSTARRLGTAYMKFKKDTQPSKDQGEAADEESAKEPPIDSD